MPPDPQQAHGGGGRRSSCCHQGRNSTSCQSWQKLGFSTRCRKCGNLLTSSDGKRQTVVVVVIVVVIPNEATVEPRPSCCCWRAPMDRMLSRQCCHPQRNTGWGSANRTPYLNLDKRIKVEEWGGVIAAKDATQQAASHDKNWDFPLVVASVAICWHPVMASGRRLSLSLSLSSLLWMSPR